MVGKPVNPKCGLLVECVGNRHDDNTNIMHQNLTGGSSSPDIKSLYLLIVSGRL